MKRFLYNLFVLSIALCFLCKDKRTELVTKTVMQDSQPPSPKVRTPFIPPPDSSITISQLQSWTRCNSLLDSLTFRYADSFKTKDPSTLIRYQKEFMTAQDKICLKAGLSGGYMEYKWILQNMGIEKNRKLLDSIYVKAF